MQSKPNPTRAFGLVFVVSLILLVCGCGDKSIKKVTVEADPSVEGMLVTLDLVGVNKLDLPRYEAYSVSQYWTQDDPLRKSNQDFREHLPFVGSLESVMEFDVTEDRWKEWYKSGVRYLVVIADIPGIVEDTPGNNARRQIIPLDAKELKQSLGEATRKVRIRVRDVGLLVQSE